MNFKFYMPTNVVIGRNVVVDNYILFKEHGRKALIVTGKNSAKINGSLNDVIKALSMADINYEIFDKVEENPSLETIEEAAKLGKNSKVDFVIGIGGGSPLDASKAIAVMIKNPEITKDTIITNKTLEALDVVAVPTTSGTGSETTQYSIVTVHKEKTKKNLGQSIFPKLALLDGKYTEFLGKETTINTAVDAFSHLVESYLNINANLITDGIIEKALGLWGQCIESLMSGELSLEHRDKLMLISTMAGMVIAQTGTSLPHGMGYPLTYFKNIPHGLANGCLYKEYLNIFKNRQKVDNIWRLLGLKSYEELKVVLSKLATVNIKLTEDEIKEYTDGMWNNKAKLKNHPEDITYDDIYKIYKNSLG